MNGHNKTFELLKMLMQYQKKSQDDIMLIITLTRCIKNVMSIVEGIEAISKSSENMKVLTRTVDYINLISQDMIIRILLGVATKSKEGHS